MKFVCLGYIADGKWESLSESERTAMMEECFDYDDWLRRNQHWLGGEALQSARAAKTLRYQGGGVVATDGPYAETKEQIGGFFLFEAASLQEALDIAAKWPSARLGTIEVRPVEDGLRADRRYGATE